MSCDCCITSPRWEILKGSEASRTVAVTVDGLPFDISAATSVTAQLKDKRTAGTVANGPVITCVDVAPADFSNGVVYVSLLSADTSQLTPGDRANQLEIKIDIATDSFITFANVDVYVYETVQG
jgi:hypothetical protein